MSPTAYDLSRASLGEVSRLVIDAHALRSGRHRIINLLDERIHVHLRAGSDVVNSRIRRAWTLAK